MAQRRKKPGKGSSKKGSTPDAIPFSDIERIEASEEAKAAVPSDVDAMGDDKRREVVGHSYGPSRKSQMVFFGVVAAVALLVIGGSALLVAAFDQPADDYPDEAPWSEAEAASNPPTRDPSGPCGEPGNPPRPTPDSPCAGRITSEGDPVVAGSPETAPDEDSGGVTGSGGDAAESQGSTDGSASGTEPG